MNCVADAATDVQLWISDNPLPLSREQIMPLTHEPEFTAEIRQAVNFDW